MCFSGQAKVLNPGLSKNVFSPSSPFSFIRIQSFHIIFTFISIHISDPCSIYGCFFFLYPSYFFFLSLPAVFLFFSRRHHRFIAHPPAHLNISPLLPRFPLSSRAHATHSGVTRTASDSRRTCYLVTRL